ncbi:hypothetical protein BO86DRAFT_47205 [Aspergillus japonicus CBS 114.51]|uniref:Uncharacterized protein n=1 Tax=Aspergillus japonicus CBS 114.51 TaxID=1448312 RepID=A0A8T8X7B9_ASPJA|nr:hypothetical protein BO86DRAFT_47205 [Aspergillus japonicus CBS 114.51]RAH83349.1 hypothetical protein BO86DRAFT_47205 [Aspergillus japonicus CBS 114.51]
MQISTMGQMFFASPIRSSPAQSHHHHHHHHHQISPTLLCSNLLSLFVYFRLKRMHGIVIGFEPIPPISPCFPLSCQSRDLNNYTCVFRGGCQAMKKENLEAELILISLSFDHCSTYPCHALGCMRPMFPFHAN